MNIVQFLEDPLWKVYGIPIGQVPHTFLSISLGSRNAGVLLSAQAVDMLDRTEAFFLSATKIPLENLTLVATDDSSWAPVDLLALANSSMRDLYENPRTVNFYRDPEDELRGLKPNGPLDSAAAIEFSSSALREAGELVLYATPEYPCFVELITDPDRCARILSGLKKFVPDTALRFVVE